MNIKVKPKNTKLHTTTPGPVFFGIFEMFHFRGWVNVQWPLWCFFLLITITLCQSLLCLHCPQEVGGILLGCRQKWVCYWFMPQWNAKGRKSHVIFYLPVLASDSNVSRHIHGCTLLTKSLARGDVWVKFMKNLPIDVSASSPETTL